jgi:hypothetical protein
LYARESKLPFAVYVYAASVLARAGAASGRVVGMKRDEAESMLRALAGDGSAARFFDGGDVAGLMLGAAEIFFEYDAVRGSLACGALAFRFRSGPRAGVLEAFFEEAGGARAAKGGALVFREETRSLLLVRTYFEAAPVEEFAREMKRLAAASLGWGAEVLERVASRHERGAGDEGPDA